MQKIVHLTDPHVRPSGETVLGLDPVARLSDVIRSINTNHGDAALCVVTGDLADRGELEAYRRLADCLADLAVPYRLLLGNHDARGAFRAVFPDSDNDGEGFVQGTAELGEAVCLFLDTLDEARAAAGYLCARRLAWLEARLADYGDRKILVFMHHPPLSIGLSWFDDMLLSNGAETMARLRHHGNVVHLAFGHVHVNVSGSWNGLSYSASRGTCHKILTDPAARTADYADHGPAYNLLLLGEAGVSVHSVDPAGSNAVIAREHATPDGAGRFEFPQTAGARRWM